MAYFVADGGSFSASQMRSNAEVLTDRLTLTFRESGTYYIRVDEPKIGEVFGQLNDVTVVKDGFGGGIIQDVAEPGVLAVSQLGILGNGTYTINPLSGGVGTSGLDEVLAQRYPGLNNNSSYSKLVMPAGQSSVGYLPEFYLEVRSSPGFFDEVYGAYGLDAPNDGRVLITRGTINGQRDIAWGNWLDEVTISGGTDPTTPTPPTETLITLEELAKAQKSALADLQQKHDLNVKAMQQLDAVRFDLEAQQQRLSSLNDEQALSTGVLILKGAALAGNYATYFIPAKAPASALSLTYDAFKQYGDAKSRVDSTTELFKDPTLGNFQNFDATMTSWLVDANGYKGALKNWFDGVQTLKETYDFGNSIGEYIDDRARVNDSIDRTQQRIIDLQQRALELENKLQQIGTQTLSRSSEKVQINEAGSFVEFKSGQSKVVLALSEGNSFDINGAKDGNVAVSLMDNGQKVSFKSGLAVVDGQHSKGDTVIMPGTRAEYTETNAGTVGAVFEKAGQSVTVIDVDRVHFSNGTLAFDVDGGERAGLAYRTYQAAFDRTPDANGLGFHIKNLDAGQSATAMATGFLNSPEFKSLYGENTADGNFINALYRNVLGRDADIGGMQYYMDRLAASPGDRANILIGFADSPENIELTTVGTSSGVWFPDV